MRRPGAPGVCDNGYWEPLCLVQGHGVAARGWCWAVLDDRASHSENATMLSEELRLSLERKGIPLRLEAGRTRV